jgi:hypothetical protein
MSVAIPEFWTLVVQSGILSPQQCQQLAGHYVQIKGASPDGPADVLAEWLIDQRAISRYQAMVLLAGYPGPFIFGDYIVYDRAEEGRLSGMFRAVHGPTSHPVCLYFVTGPAAQDPQRFAALSQWCAQAAQVRSPYVARAYHVVDTGTYKFIVLEDLRGETLEQKLAAGPIASATACGWARHAALGLAQMHQLGQLHAEIRPANLWIDAAGSAKLLYFPLWRDPLAGPTVLASGADRLALAADYLAPEVAAGHSPEPRSEVYGLGCLLYHMLTGRPPFEGAGIEQKLARHLSDVPRPANHVHASVPPPVAQVVEYCLEKDPSRRYQHAANVAQSLQPYAEPALVNPVPELLTAASQAYEAWLPQLQGWPPISALPPAPPPPTVAPPAAPPPVAAMPLASPAWGTGAMVGRVAQAIPVAAAAMPQAVPVSDAIAVAQPAAAEARPITTTSRAAPALALSDSAAGPVSRANRQNRQMLMTAGSVVGAVVVVGAIIFMLSGKTRPPKPPGNGTEIVENNGEEKSKTTPGKTGEKTDDPGFKQKQPPTQFTEYVTPVRGDEFWESPTNGPPLDLAYLPSGVQVFIALRPAALMAHPQGKYLLETHDLGAAGKVSVLGPLGDFARSEVSRLCGGLPWEELEHVVIGIIPKAGGAPQAALVARTRNPASLEGLTKAAGLEYRLAGGSQNILVAAPGKAAAEAAAAAVGDAKPDAPLIDQAMANDKGPVISLPAMEALQRVSDNQRMFTVLFASGFTFSGDDFPIWKGLAEGLKGPVSAFMGDPSRLQAGMFSMHLGDQKTFLELRLYPTAQVGPVELAAELDRRIGELPDAVEKHILSLDTVKFSRPILFRLPGAVKEVPTWTIVASSKRPEAPTANHAVARCYLPDYALNTLSYSAYLAAAQASGGGGTTVPITPKEDEPKTILEKLARKKASLTDNDEFQRLVKTMMDDARIPFEIMGPDLQNDGITRNKRVAADFKDLPLGEILRKMFLMVDPSGNLVYFVKKEGNEEKLFISTRKKTAERKDTLPPEFAAPPKKKP